MAFSRPASPLLSVSVGVQTHPGKVRSENQDRVSSARTPYGDVYLLADGVGGQARGAEAAQYVVAAFIRLLLHSEEENAVHALKRAASEINSDLKNISGTPDFVPGMSSTVVLALIQDRHAIVGHIGDSRAYLVRGGHVEQLTHDHSLVERLISENYLKREDARTHPDANVLTQALGQATDVELDTLELDLSPGDALLLCSDGLWGYSMPGEIDSIVTAPALSAQAASEALLNIALKNGGRDNVSLQFLRFGDQVETLALPAASSRRTSTNRAMLLAAGTGVLAVLAWITLYNFRTPVDSPAMHSNERAAASLPPAASTKTNSAPTSSSNSNQGVSVTTAVVVSFPHTELAPWQQRMKALERVAVSETTEDLCALLIKPQAKLYYTSEGAGEARRIQRAVNAPEAALTKATAGQLSSCTTAQVVAVPAAAASVVQRATDIESEIERQAPADGSPSLPSQLPIPKH